MSTTTTTFTVPGMTCGGCVTKVTAAVTQLDDVTGTDVDLTTGTLTVTGVDVDDTTVRNAIFDAGYRVG